MSSAYNVVTITDGISIIYSSYRAYLTLSICDFHHLYRHILPTETEDFEKWRVLFKPCASQRLFFPQILTHLDHLLYVDTDILFLKPVQDIWQLFSKFNSSQLAALAPEHEDKAMGW